MLLALDLDDAHPAGAEARAAWARSRASGSRSRCRGRPRGSSGPRSPRRRGRRPRSGCAATTAVAAATACRAGARRATPATAPGRLVGARQQVGHGRLMGSLPAATAIGWQTPAGQELRRRCSSSSDRKYRIPLASGRVVRRSWSHRAEATMSADRSASSVEVGRARPALGDAVGDLHEPAGPDPARDRLAARLAGAEAGQEPGQVDDAGPIVGDDDRAGADVGAGRRAATRRRTGVSSRSGGSRPPDGPPTRIALIERPAGSGAAELHDLAQRRAERDLGDAVAGRRPKLHEDRAGGCRGGRSPRTAAAPWRTIHGDGRQGLDVVDDRRHAEEAALGRIRRSLLRLAALALEGLEQDGLLAEHVGALDRRAR